MAACLLIDDSRLARRICRALLEQLGHSVTEAEEGIAGLAACASRAFEFILVDQNMPLMGGVDFIRHFRRQSDTVPTPIILCSSDPDPHLVRAALHHGADAYLNKPYTAQALRRRLHRLAIDGP